MSETKVFSFPSESAANGGAMAWLAPMLANRGVDTATLASMLNNNNGGLFGGRGFEDIIALIIVAAIFGNGNFGFGGNNNGNSTERQMLMDAIQRNGIDISQLASTLNCSISQVESGINSVATQICNLSAQSGQNTASIIAALQQGNMALTQQLASCCCDIKQLVTVQGYQDQIAVLNQTNALTSQINSVATGLERGFSQTAFETQSQTCALQQSAENNTRAILAKLDAIEDSRKDREISNLTAQLTAANSRAERQSELAPIYKALNDIQCKQPTTKTITTHDNYIPVNYGLNVPLTFGYGCGLGFNGNNGFGFSNAF